MTNADQGETPAAKVEPEDARQAEIGTDGPVRGPMRYVLIVSTVGVIIAFLIAYVFIV